MSNSNNNQVLCSSNELFESLKSIERNDNIIECIDKDKEMTGFENQLEKQFEQFQKGKRNDKDNEEDSSELLDNSDILSLSKSSSSSINNGKKDQLKDISNFQISFSNISELDRKQVPNEDEGKDKDKENEYYEEQGIDEESFSLSTTSIKLCSNPVLNKPKEASSLTPSTLCNYYQRSNEVTPIQSQKSNMKETLFNPVNIHQVNLNLIYNTMNNNTDELSSKKPTSSLIKYTKAQCSNSNSNNNVISNEGLSQLNQPLITEYKAGASDAFSISNNDNIEYINKGINKPQSKGNNSNSNNAVYSQKPKRKAMILVKVNAIQLSIGLKDNHYDVNSNSNQSYVIKTCDNINIVKTKNNDKDTINKECTNVYFNGLRFGSNGETNPFSISNRQPNKIKDNTLKDIDTNINYEMRNVKTESTAFDSQTPKAESNALLNPHIPPFTTSKKVKEIITCLINKNKPKSTSKPQSNNRPNQHLHQHQHQYNNSSRNMTLTSRNNTKEDSLKKVSFTQLQQKKGKSVSNDKNNKQSNRKPLQYASIIKIIKQKDVVVNHNMRPLSSLFNFDLISNQNPKSKANVNTKANTSNTNVNATKSKSKSKSKGKTKAKPYNPHQKVNTQINLATILSKFQKKPAKRFEQSSRQSTLSTFLNETILNNNTNNTKVNDTFSKIVLHTQETNNTTEANTNPNNNDMNNQTTSNKYAANTSIASIKKIPKVIQNFSCYKKKNSFQSHFVSKEEMQTQTHNDSSVKAQCLKLNKLNGDDDDFSITDD